MNDAKDVEHKCGQVLIFPLELDVHVLSNVTQCGITLATWHRSGTTEIRYQG
jgi:hypothetical protein